MDAKDPSHPGVIVDPQERLKRLINFSNAIEVDSSIPPTRYYRSGLEMVRMASVYYKEGSLENAYVLYLKFMTLFLEKIRKHPDFASVPTGMKATNQAKLREVLPRAEALKKELLHQYEQEYNRYVTELKLKLKQEQERVKQAQKTPIPSKATTDAKKGQSAAYAQVHTPINVDGISYPDPNLPSAPPLSPEDIPQSVPSFDRSKKPSDIFPAYARSGLRIVVIPAKVMIIFQALAQKNTLSNVETCGILAGKLEKDELFITHMILPKQKGTSDSCTTSNEEELFDFQDQHNLITIGWIHTHPTQTAFLSSVDLHTQCPYQLLMPEAIAIVCAPRYNETGFFVLTPNGLKFIANCRQSGFHPHPTEPPLFMPAEHVRIDQEASLEVLDMRTIK